MGHLSEAVHGSWVDAVCVDVPLGVGADMRFPQHSISSSAPGLQ